MSMLDNLKKLEDSGKVGGGDYFKVQEKDNIIRVLSEGIYHEDEYRDKKTGKAKTTKNFVMFVIDRRDGKVKPYFATYTVYKQIASLEEDPFYKFQGMPMPYDINIKVTNAGIMNVEYNVQASPTETELTPALPKRHTQTVRLFTPPRCRTEGGLNLSACLNNFSLEN